MKPDETPEIFNMKLNARQIKAKFDRMYTCIFDVCLFQHF